MQERRLLQFLSEEDIPSSAITPSKNSYCNVVYVPVGATLYGSINLRLYNNVSNNYLYILNPFTISNNQPITNYSYIRLYSNYIQWQMYDDTYRSIYYVLSGYDTYNSENLPMSLNQNGFLGYVKIKLSKSIMIYSYDNDTLYPFYVDTEE